MLFLGCAAGELIVQALQLALFPVDVLDSDDASGDVSLGIADGGGAGGDPDAAAVAALIEDLFGVGDFSLATGAGEMLFVRFQLAA